MTRMRVVVVTLLLVIFAQQSFAESNGIKTWHNVISDSTDTGTLGGVSISLSGNVTSDSNTMMAEDWPQLIEVYTATWCTNCVQTESVTNSLIIPEGESIMQVHYHRFIAETQDPFGSQETDERWVERYGQTSLLSGSFERIAPSNVFDGERLHIGTSPKSDSLNTDYQMSSDASPSIEYSDFSATLNWFNESGFDTFSWNISTPSLSESYTISPKLFFIEEVGYFPEGGNGEDYYHHILRDVINLPSQEGELSTDYNSAYDGDDLSVVLVFDWHYNNYEEALGALPYPSATIFVSFFIAAFHSRKDN
ncbi:MAG: hypothetical protein OR994_00475 [Candidatus Poseidoniales archaeon]|nr:hypothetical protein [Candidatus Poseidoniales archaeon]